MPKKWLFQCLKPGGKRRRWDLQVYVKKERKVYIFQSKLSNIGSSQMEEDFKLVSDEGLFQEYLEMSMIWFNINNNDIYDSWF